MNLTPEQREQVVSWLEGPAKIEQAGRMLAVPYADFVEDWTTGRADSDHRRDTEAARFYQDAQAARHRYIATLRSDAEAVAAVNPREAESKLKLAATMESDTGPLANEEDDVRKSSRFLRVADIIANGQTTSEEREALLAAQAEARAGQRELLRQLTARDARIREERGTPRPV